MDVYQERRQQIELLQAVGIQVQRTKGSIHYFEAVREDSQVFPQAASFVQRLMEKYVSLQALVEHGFRTPRDAKEEYISQLRQARDDAREWGKRTRGNTEVAYVSRTLDEKLSAALRQLGEDRPRRF